MVRSTNSRCGLTFIEVLLMVALLFFLAGLLIASVAGVRRAAGDTISMNNLKQLALATHAFHDAYNGFPPAVGKVGNNEGTAHFFLLPFVEMDTIYKNAQGAVWKNNTNGQVIRLFLDGDDPTAPPGNLYKDWLATTNYAVNWMVFKTGGGNLAQVPDGTSNTLMFTTRYQMCNGQPTAWGYPTLYYWSPIFAHYSHAKFQTAPAPNACDPALAQSINNKSILTAFCDGSGRQVSIHVSPLTWGYLCDPADGNVLPDDF